MNDNYEGNKFFISLKNYSIHRKRLGNVVDCQISTFNISFSIPLKMFKLLPIVIYIFTKLHCIPMDIK